MTEQELQAMGARLKATAAAAGFSSGRLAEQLEVTGGAVRGWWVGRNEISLGLLIRYAKLVNRSLAYLITGREDEDPEAVLLAWANLVMAGHEPGAALDRVRGTTAGLTPRERDLLAAQATLIREDLAAAAGQDWENLSRDQQRQVLRRISALVRQFDRPASAE